MITFENFPAEHMEFCQKSDHLLFENIFYEVLNLPDFSEAPGIDCKCLSW